MAGPGLRIEALGVAGAPAPNRLTTTFRLTGGILVDTGAAMHGVPPAELAGIETILLSHAHLDHTLGLPFLLAEKTLHVYGLQETLDAVRESLLDGRVWPDLHARGTWQEIEAGTAFEAGPWKVEAGAAHHTVPCLSYVLRGEGRTVAIIGDTSCDDALLAWAAQVRPDVCVVEASWPDAGAEQARRFGHQTPQDLRAWRDALGPACRILVTHLKPAYEVRVRTECEALGDPNLDILRPGDVV